MHEWYHNPVRNRKAFYSFPVYWGLTLLEKTGLASTRRHALHHAHKLDNLNEVEDWLDLYLPFGDALASMLWRKALARYEPGKTRMNDFACRLGRVKALLRGGLAPGSTSPAHHSPL